MDKLLISSSYYFANILEIKVSPMNFHLKLFKQIRIQKNCYSEKLKGNGISKNQRTNNIKKIWKFKKNSCGEGYMKIRRIVEKKK